MTITRLVFVWVCLFTLFFTAIIGLIHLQPYDDSPLRAFLTPPEGCPGPCFMGIRPGVTTADEAVMILEAHEWVEPPRVLEATDGRGIYAITANWSGMQPGLIDSAEALWMGVEDDIIQRIVVSMNIRLGDVWLSLGSPLYGGLLEDTSEGEPFVTYYGAYLALSSSFATGQVCPIDSIWNLQSLWIIGGGLSSLDSASEDMIPNQVYAACRRLLGDQ
jgi:hypothetical protein